MINFLFRYIFILKATTHLADIDFGSALVTTVVDVFKEQDWIHVNLFHPQYHG